MRARFVLNAALGLICALCLVPSSPARAVQPQADTNPKAASKATQSVPQHPNPEALQLALKAAEQFLSLMDQRDYAQAWDQAAHHFKASVDRDVWVRLAGAARDPLGEIKARRPGLSRAAKDLPKGPVGDYIIINFETDIAIEPITEMLVMYREELQQWRCIGYFVRPR